MFCSGSILSGAEPVMCLLLSVSDKVYGLVRLCVCWRAISFRGGCGLPLKPNCGRRSGCREGFSHVQWAGSR